MSQLTMLTLSALIASAIAQTQRSEFCGIGTSWDAVAHACVSIGAQAPAHSASNPVVFPHNGSLVTTGDAANFR